MTVCPACRHSNAEYLPYCSACGRRVRAPAAATAPTLATPAPTTSLPTVADGLLSPGLAATIAMAGTPAGGGPASSPTAEPAPGVVQRGVRAVGYVFTTIRGRLDAEERRRGLTAERDGALRLSEGTLTEVGQTVLAQNLTGPRLNELRETAQRLAKRREGILADLAATEKFQAAEDLRLGLLEATAETEWKNSDASVQEAEAALKKNEGERREAKDALARLDAAGTAASPSERQALEQRRVQLDEQQRTLRERAAALSASQSALQARLDQATAARKHARAAVAASLAGRQRERAQIEDDLRNVTARIGAQAIESRLPSPHLQGAYERFDRLADVVRATEAELARVESLRGGLNHGQFAAGLGIILGLTTTVIVALWKLMR
jgi:hypothetical protein